MRGCSRTPRSYADRTAGRQTSSVRVALRDGELVDALVLGDARVALDEMPFDVVAGHFDEQLLPKVPVLDRLLLGVPPAVRLPTGRPPAGEAVHHVAGVHVDADAARAMKARRPLTTADSSILLFVVSNAPPSSSRSFAPRRSSAPHPPGPGLPEQAPSVHRSTTVSVSSGTCGVRAAEDGRVGGGFASATDSPTGMSAECSHGSPSLCPGDAPRAAQLATELDALCGPDSSRSHGCAADAPYRPRPVALIMFGAHATRTPQHPRQTAGGWRGGRSFACQLAYAGSPWLGTGTSGHG